MLINLSDFFEKEFKKSSSQVEYTISKLPFEYGSETITAKEPVELTIYNKEKGLAIVEGKTSIELELPCDRCLTPTKVQVDIEFEREVYAPERLNEDEDQKDDQLFVEEYQMDVDKLMDEEMVINWPTEILCMEECKGLCPKCGHNLNEGECGCDTFVPDPRMAGIADLFSQFKLDS